MEPEIKQKPIRPLGTSPNYDDASKETLIMWLEAHHADSFKMRSQYHEIYHTNNELKTKLGKRETTSKRISTEDKL